MRKYILGFQKKVQEKLEKLKADSVNEKVIPKREKEEKNNEIYLNIKITTILKIIVTILLTLGLASVIKDISEILLLVFISIILAAAISPIVDWAESKKIPRIVSILILYIVFIGFIGLMISSLIPIIITQIIDLATFLQGYINKLINGGIEGVPFGKYLEPLLRDIAENIKQADLLAQIKESAQSIALNVKIVAGNTFSAVSYVFGGLFQAFTVLFFTFIMVLDPESLKTTFITLIPNKYHKYLITQGMKIQEKLGGWFRGTIIMMFIIGVTVYVGLSIIGVKYAPTFALIAALTEIIPVIGPLIAMVICVPIILTQSLILGGVSTIFFLVINSLESNILVPIVMKKTIGLNVITTVLAMMIGGQLLGVIGIILAVPVASSLNVLIQDYSERKK